MNGIFRIELHRNTNSNHIPIKIIANITIDICLFTAMMRLDRASISSSPRADSEPDNCSRDGLVIIYNYQLNYLKLMNHILCFVNL